MTPEKRKALETLRMIVGDPYFITDTESMSRYVYECTTGSYDLPSAVLIPGSVEEIAAITKLCNEHLIPVTIRGGGTGVSKGAVAQHKGMILSMERLNKIISIDKINRTVIAEAGVLTKTLRDAVKKEGLTFPQNISSASGSFIGGNIAVSSGSPKSLKYGPTKNGVLNLEVVLANGTVIWTGKNISKNATGYNLTQLFAGSEGTLGIITKVVLQLVPPSNEMLAVIPFANLHRLFDFVHHFFSAGLSASSMEFIDGKGYELVSAFLGRTITAPFPVKGLLWIELEGKDPEILLNEMAGIAGMISPFTTGEVFIGQTVDEIDTLWKMRSSIGYAIINHSKFLDIDIVVPCSQIHDMQTAIDRICGSLELSYVLLGHIGNGNFHINVLRGDMTTEKWHEITRKAIHRIFTVAAGLGGTLSGEHGIGTAHLPYLSLALSDRELHYMDKIKEIFDSNNILNPLFPGLS
jgi:glycolate oxidase